MELIKYRNLFSKYSTGEFNYAFARIVGIVPAVYFSELMLQSFSVCTLEKEWFQPKYTDVQRLLNISREEQDSYIGSFKELDILEQDGKLIRLKLDIFSKITANVSEDTICKYQQKVSEGALKVINGNIKKLNKVKDNLKYQIRGNDVELRELYFKWIDAIVDKFGMLPNETAIAGQSLASNYAKGDKKIEKAILEKAIINVYKDMSWAINAFEKTLTIEGNLASANPVTLTQPVVLPSTVESEDEEVTFGGVV